jgi:hypothetical protein
MHRVPQRMREKIIVRKLTSFHCFSKSLPASAAISKFMAAITIPLTALASATTSMSQILLGLIWQL